MDKIYFLIITFGFLLAMRGERPASPQRPAEGLTRIGRENADFFFTASLILALWGFVEGFEKAQSGVREYAVVAVGMTAYLLSRYQKKGDVFFLSVVACVFMISSKQRDLLHGISLAFAVSTGMALFQTCFLGLRYKLLFSRVPVSMKGWSSLSLLAGFVSVVLWGFWKLVF